MNQQLIEQILSVEESPEDLLEEFAESIRDGLLEHVEQGEKA